ncbi:uncharacterized protein LOC117782069 [Drosophila innubila]|uniref:uncharacterized protein LOC117782069 n=1 Tax=Drosophila innubila TaxID=198719 RepID=UPI00148CF561|nr:uncharacterized protein LOC117782069 [Drosophila innubila]
MAFLNTDEIDDIDSLSSEQREENARNLKSIESLDDIYKTYRPLPRTYCLSSSSTSTLKDVDNAQTVESKECNKLQETIAKTDITNVTMEKYKTENGQKIESQSEEEKENKKPLSTKKTPPPPPPRPSRSPRPSAPPPPEEITDSDKDKKLQMRIASGEVTETQTQGLGCEHSNSIESQNSYSTNPNQSGNSVKFMNGENCQQEMIASDYYAQQIAMQMSNPLYSYGGYGQSQLLSGPMDYQFQSPESEHFNNAQLQGYLQSFSNYGQYSTQGMPGGGYIQSDGSGLGQYSQYQYMAGGGGNCTDCHPSCPAEERAGAQVDSGESCTDDSTTCSEKSNSFCSDGASSLEDSSRSCCTGNCCPGNPNVCFLKRPCPEDERGFEMPECIGSMPQCRVGRGQCPPTQSRFSFVDVNVHNNAGNMCPMEMPFCGGMPNGCALPCCMIPPPNCGPMQCCSAPPSPPCGPMPCCSAPLPPQGCRIPSCSAPAPSCGTMPCCSPTPECCACSGNCLNVEGFMQKFRAAQGHCCCPGSCPMEQPCCGDDRLQSYTVYTADYQPLRGCGNNFNHFPKCDNCGSCGSCGSCPSCMGCMPPVCCPPPNRAASGGCCQLPYQLPCCTMPPSYAPSSSAACAAPFPATCSTPCYAPCAVPCLSTCPPPCGPSYPTCGTDPCFSSCPLPCEMPSGPCCEPSPLSNAISQATSCNFTQCASPT